MDNCPERMNVVDAEAAESILSEAVVALDKTLFLLFLPEASLTIFLAYKEEE